MEIVADLHLHSKYSRAVSPQMIVLEMAKWAKIKGINLLGTGDFTHPLWLSELKSCLKEYGQGVFKIKSLQADKEAKFLLTAEISSIYSQNGKTRKIHNILIAPSFDTVEKINNELKKRGGNLSSDGRPIVGLSAKSIAELVLSIDKKVFIIPAHIWTPWFSLFGANSGFNRIEECFGEFGQYIYTVETGLSSDPQMNWRIKDLDNRSLVSFSDAHSGEKLGREATVFETDRWDFAEIVKAIKSNQRIKYTIEFYPEEGKYHYSGHRKCGVVFSPQDSLKRGNLCPVCGKKLTPGVMEQVEKFSGFGQLVGKTSVDKTGVRWIENRNRPPFVKLVPLKEIIAESLKTGVGSKKVDDFYFKLIGGLGNEMEILLKSEMEKIKKCGGEKLAEGIAKVRRGEIFISPGFDGEFGKVKVWGLSLFG
ncbi:DNA helicase UvrD [Candidatus Shapirobacteria bacterium CG09_land_8_20_14_0_10_39_12]|uniref:DNA helicase UvrD n=1 Tax=Candidatus Shapirobacteria bacterium CG09_land_8_20_14_0_10_39_12 TaxID=1974885 RepID=A0A2H0WQ12_9BACT|nr:MAG: DNA helicase UvrD [Candidatus Shapirobacteria bacterium CG09_land_8_20_14_0_10_39_12]